MKRNRQGNTFDPLQFHSTNASLSLSLDCRFHPFYISDSDEGGYGQKSQLKQSRQTVYAGVEFEADGYPRPSAAGRYCEWQHLTVDKSSEIETFEAYKKTLKLECEPGEATALNWTVAFDTPNLVYYQASLMLRNGETHANETTFLTVLHTQQSWVEDSRRRSRHDSAQ